MSSNSNADPATLTAPTATSTDAAESLGMTPSPSTDTNSTNPSSPMPLSPARSQQGPSVPSSPSPNSSSDRSPALTPTQPQRGGQWQPPQEPQQPQQQQQPNNGVALGLEQLERQQDEAERRRREQATTTPIRQAPPQQQRHHTSPVMMQRYLEDDDHTAPSSTQESGHPGSHSLGTDGSTSLGSGDDNVSPGHGSGNKPAVSTKFEKMIQKTRRRLSSNDFFLKRRSSGEIEDPAEDDEAEAVDALIYGHLQKLGRNGKWQTRWFESDGECLSYYKTSKRTKLLATLDLEKVGAIVVNEDDPKGCTFTIQVVGRPYYLRAESRAACKDWVITLNRVKEARLQQGNVKLVTHNTSGFRNPPDLLDRNVSTYTAGVVAVANRQRTRAMDEATIENMEELHKANPDHAQQYNPAYYGQGEEELGGSLSDIVLARWQKQKSGMSRLGAKLARWARSLNKYKCNDVGSTNVRLDRHVHPPGHDYGSRKRSLVKKIPKVLNPLAAQPAAGPVVSPEDEEQGVEQQVSDPVQHGTSLAAAGNVDEEEETRELS